MKYFILVGLAFILSGCASTADKSDNPIPKISELLAEATEQNGRECFYISDIRGYGHKKSVVTVNAGRNYYLLTTVPKRCHAIDAVAAASFSGPQNQVCGGGSSRVTTRDGQCMISKVFEFESREQAFEVLDEALEKIETIKKELKD